MKIPIRITIAVDENIANLIDEMRNNLKVSQSELIRRALRFYYEYKNLLGDVPFKKISTYLDMLPKGEHIILDVDHWLLFLKLAESLPEKDKFWDTHKEIAKSHADQLSPKVKSVKDLLERLEACNFFNLSIDSPSSITLLLGSDIPKKFIKVFLEEVITEMGYNFEIKEDLAKLRIKIKKNKDKN